MMSDLTRNDLDTLLSMEIKLRLLDLENIQIPDAPPPIPKEPSNYDFVYDCNWSARAPEAPPPKLEELANRREEWKRSHALESAVVEESCGPHFLWPQRL